MKKYIYIYQSSDGPIYFTSANKAGNYAKKFEHEFVMGDLRKRMKFGGLPFKFPKSGNYIIKVIIF